MKQVLPKNIKAAAFYHILFLAGYAQKGRIRISAKRFPYVKPPQFQLYKVRIRSPKDKNNRENDICRRVPPRWKANKDQTTTKHFLLNHRPFRNMHFICFLRNLISELQQSVRKNLSSGTIPEDILVWRSFRAPRLDMLPTLDSFRKRLPDIMQNCVPKCRLYTLRAWKWLYPFYLGFTSYLKIPIDVGLISPNYLFSGFLVCILFRCLTGWRRVLYRCIRFNPAYSIAPRKCGVPRNSISALLKEKKVSSNSTPFFIKAKN